MAQKSTPTFGFIDFFKLLLNYASYHKPALFVMFIKDNSLYNLPQAVTSLCWQRSKPVMVNANNCTAETALLGGALEDSILMPDPLPSMTASSASMLNSLNSSTAEETPLKSTLWGGGALARLNASRAYNFKDDMEVFSPLMEVQPITPSVNKLLEGREGLKKDHLLVDNKPSALFPSSSKRYSSEEGSSDLHPIFDWKASSTFKQVHSFPHL